jgi:hypothetical protein
MQLAGSGNVPVIFTSPYIRAHAAKHKGLDPTYRADEPLTSRIHPYPACSPPPLGSHHDNHQPDVL